MLIIKIGGGATINVKGIIADLATVNEKFIIVHGANALRDQLAKALGKPKKILTSVSGYSSVYSDETALDLLMMAYAGLKNKRIVELCHQHGINAVGLSGIDGRVIQGQRNKGIRVKENGKLRIVRDFSGKPRAVNKDLLQLLLDNHYTPVLTIPIIDENQFAINSENDDIVNVLQSTFKARVVIQLIEAPGFLEDKDDPTSLVKTLSKQELYQREKQVTGRMKRKMLALRKLFDNGAHTVVISDGRVAHPIHDALNGKGTIIK
ncbi:MAG: [LysW]-aminoadipate kinase [Calditrichaeota bacterium]|nr:MAG: [LysW]-aminoadipate kinase [Calditrichota bacterium]